jgi:hypothetical protein
MTTVFSMSALGGDMWNWMRPILAFSTRVGPPAALAAWVGDSSHQRAMQDSEEEGCVRVSIHPDTQPCEKRALRGTRVTMKSRPCLLVKHAAVDELAVVNGAADLADDTNVTQVQPVRVFVQRERQESSSS